jgi:small subunit ribosomal protein S20
MPIKQNAKKAFRQSLKRAARNKKIGDELKSLRVKFRKLIAFSDIEKATEAARLLGQKLDKAAGRDTIKKNTAARLKSRMMAKLNGLKKK